VPYFEYHIPKLGSVDVLPLPYLSHSKVAAKESISMK